MDAGILTLISVALNAVVAILAPLFARRYAEKKSALVVAQDTLQTVSNGLVAVEQAIEENKDALSRSAAGDAVVRTIRTYGPAATAIVDAARDAAHQIADVEYESRIIAQEHAEHAARVQSGEIPDPDSDSATK